MEWEYFVHAMKTSGALTTTFDAEETARILNWYGSQGWELDASIPILINGHTSQIALIFRRQKARPAAAAGTS